jgi:ribosomal protein L14
MCAEIGDVKVHQVGGACQNNNAKNGQQMALMAWEALTSSVITMFSELTGKRHKMCAEMGDVKVPLVGGACQNNNAKNGKQMALMAWVTLTFSGLTMLSDLTGKRQQMCAEIGDIKVHLVGGACQNNNAENGQQMALIAWVAKPFSGITMFSELTGKVQMCAEMGDL